MFCGFYGHNSIKVIKEEPGRIATNMDDYVMIEQLEELARGFGIQCRYEPISFEEETINVVGGFCKLRGKALLIINSKATEKDKIKIFVQALRRFDLEQIYIKPAIRALLDGRDCL